MDGMLSQEEINALLRDLGADGADNQENVITEHLTDAEKDAIGEISNISMGTAATTLFSLVNQKVVITTPVVEYATWEDITKSYDRPCVFIQIYYSDGLDGNNILILKEKDVKVITDLMMGGDGTNIDGKLSDLHLSAISEAMNQMMGSAATSISSMLNKRVNISPPSANIVEMNENISGENIAEFLKQPFVKVSFNMVIGDLVDSVLMQLYPFEFARNLYKEFISANSMETEAEPIETDTETVTVQREEPREEPNAATSFAGETPQNMQTNIPYMNQNQSNMNSNSPYMRQLVQDINVQPAQFAPFTPLTQSSVTPENIDLLMDVPLEVTVELGRTSKSIKEILDFAPGTIIELNRMAGEPIDVLVNGKFVAKGEVVVMEEAFGIRVTEIIKQKQ
ncbi:flagellar motor switch phosphatase FliY [Herbinix luporum]|uniref:flagellar motor switch phosphatase FliY n=1 Tax=Herbinix luporum TaxID=1679721 RepID=UPI0023F2F4DD|nr:flagellar motor switch phosphatase FliY [Herbinix luporum]